MLWLRNSIESIYLPHYIVIIPDKDIIVNAQVFDYGAWDTFEQAIRWLVSNIDGTIEVRKEDLKSNKEAIWLYAELFLGHHDGSCHGLW